MKTERGDFFPVFGSIPRWVHDLMK